VASEGVHDLVGRAELALAEALDFAPRSFDFISSIAGTLAAMALRLDIDNSSWTVDVRGSLLAQGRTRRRRQPKTLLDGLLDLLLNSERLRYLALASSDLETADGR
jgi:hypothetical protein